MKASNFAALSAATLSLIASSATATTLLKIEFREDDQAGFNLWPTSSPLTGTSSTANFSTPTTTSGTTAITMTATTSLGQAFNRGTISDGTPAGFTYSNLYRDLLIASTPTGRLTLTASGLDANTAYNFTLFAWDPGDSTDRVREWTVETGSGVPASAQLNWVDPLVDNNTFAMNFEITTDATGSFSLSDTSANPQGSAINGFILEQIPEPSTALLAVFGAFGLFSRRRS